MFEDYGVALLPHINCRAISSPQIPFVIIIQIAIESFLLLLRTDSQPLTKQGHFTLRNGPFKAAKRSVVRPNPLFLRRQLTLLPFLLTTIVYWWFPDVYKRNLIPGGVYGFFAASAVLPVLLAIASLRNEGCFLLRRRLAETCFGVSRRRRRNNGHSPLQAQEVLFGFCQKRISAKPSYVLISIASAMYYNFG